MTRLARCALLGLSLLLLRLPSAAAEQIVFGLDWRAEAEYGGYYQAVATGIYAKHGLDVKIEQGGPSVNHAALLIAGRLDFNICSNSFLALNFVNEKIPFRATPTTRSGPTPSTWRRSWRTRTRYSRAISGPSRSRSARRPASIRWCCWSPMPGSRAMPA